MFFIGNQSVNRQSFTFKEINKYGKGSFVQIAAMFRAIYHVACRREDFLDIFLTTFSGARYFGNTSAMRFMFFWNIL